MTDLLRDQMKPWTLVVGNDITPEGRSACMRARGDSMPTACLLHGTIGGWPLHGYHCADKVLVYGPRPRRQGNNLRIDIETGDRTIQ